MSQWSLKEGFDILEGEIRLNLGALSLLGRVEGELDTEQIMNRVIEITKNSIRGFGKCFLVWRLNLLRKVPEKIPSEGLVPIILSTSFRIHL